MQQLEQLKRDHSIEIKKGMVAQWDDRTIELDPAKIIGRIGKQKAFATGGKVIAFASGSELFVTPYTQRTIQILRNYGYKELAFFIPFSPQGMHPADAKIAERWQSLLKEADFAIRSPEERRAELARNRSRSTDDLEIRWAQTAVATA